MSGITRWMIGAIGVVVSAGAAGAAPLIYDGTGAAGGLTYTDSQGNQLAVSAGGDLLAGSVNYVLAGRSDARADLWYAFIADQEDGGLLNIGPRFGSDVGQGGGDWSVRAGGPSWDGAWSIFDPPGTSDRYQKHFVVVRVQFEPEVGADIHLWIDPRLDQVPDPGAAALAASWDAYGWKLPDRFSIEAGGTLLIDELRAGESFVDVAPIAPVPEPASLALLVIGGLAVACRRN